MSERGLEPEFSARVEQQLASITGSASETGAQIHDLTALLWCSIDNDDSLDLDQLTVCELLASVDDHPVAVRQGRLLATSFHPELTGDGRLHALFIEMVRRTMAATTKGAP